LYDSGNELTFLDPNLQPYFFTLPGTL